MGEKLLGNVLYSSLIKMLDSNSYPKGHLLFRVPAAPLKKQGRKCADFQLAFLSYDHATTPLANLQQVFDRLF